MKPLRLKAVDDDDLEVFATVLQSARMPLAEVTWVEEDHRFAALFRRFCYELPGGDGMQVDCALVLDRVARVDAWDLDGLGGDGDAELMTIVSEGHRETAGCISLVFRSGGLIRLETDAIEGRLADIGQPATATDTPRYAVAANSAPAGDNHHDA